MAADHTTALEKAIITHLKGDAVIAGLAGARVYPPEAPANPVWPFLRYGQPITTADETMGSDGAEIRVTIHTFAEGKDAAARLAKLVAHRLDGAALVLPIDEDTGAVGGLSELVWVSTDIIRDTDEASKWHGAVQFNAAVMEPK